MTAVPRFRSYQGWPLLGNGFRPFFLLGSIYAGLAILVWLPVFHGELTLTSAFAPRDWHVHEMLHGYLPAVITGFCSRLYRTGPDGCRYRARPCSRSCWFGSRDGFA